MLIVCMAKVRDVRITAMFASYARDAEIMSAISS
jgi:hypothetical protein